MLPMGYREVYASWRSQVEACEQHSAQVNPDGPQLQAEVMHLQQTFQHQLLELAGTGEETALAPTDSALLASVNTEINKHLRLLALDLSFLKTARQPLTIQQRQAQIRDRLHRLSRYCTLIEAQGRDDATPPEATGSELEQ